MLLSTLDIQPTDIWHDTAFQFVVIAIVTFLAGIIGAIITYWIYRKQRSRKELSYQVVYMAPIALVRTDFKDRIEIKFDGKPVRNMNLLILKIWNSGNVAIKSEEHF